MLVVVVEMVMVGLCDSNTTPGWTTLNNSALYCSNITPLTTSHIDIEYFKLKVRVSFIQSKNNCFII